MKLTRGDLPGITTKDPWGSMATRQALRIEGESAAEIPHIRHTSLSCLLIVCSEHSPRRILQSEVKYHSYDTVFINTPWCDVWAFWQYYLVNEFPWPDPKGTWLSIFPSIFSSSPYFLTTKKMLLDFYYTSLTQQQRPTMLEAEVMSEMTLESPIQTMVDLDTFNAFWWWPQCGLF